MTVLSYERRTAEVVAQTGLLISHLTGAHPAAPVPSCPGWSLERLLRHLGETHRWAEEAVRTRAVEPVSDERLNNPPRHHDGDLAALGDWLAEGATRLAETLRAAGPDAQVWTPGPGGTAAFWARRMAHETAVHRADAALAVGAEYVLAEEVALDAVDEWMGFGTVPEVYEARPGAPALLGPGRTLRFHATDTAPETAADWLVDLAGGEPTWHHSPGGPTRHQSPGETAVTVQAPLTDLLFLLYRRPTRAGNVVIMGDMRLLGLWLRRTGFWLE
ncbi:maleylpyruvate isomerase family mycothiol-dependent enzyme [Streptomyces pathocidini]|uniref:Maleylpyruvate isomerase family mycothiol-dependent enzyme n=1 Tax=Streptomyces pathocidini TaxID=1650571 RepID=A0ABW7UM26_9ACTN|nr:maleylpyruvate isomerase family mycothiol-dependent enzyme [Streptomyces pathocidini]